jgi:hypothetical protein
MYKMNNYDIFHNRYEGFSTTDAIYTDCDTTTDVCADYKAKVDELTMLNSFQSKEGRESDTNDQYNKLYMSTINLGIGIVLMATFLNYLSQ